MTSWSRLALTEYGQRPAAHHELMLRKLAALERGETKRLMLLMPPGSAKSTFSSVLFPAWWMARHPRGTVIAASHTASLAAYFGRRVRDAVTDHGSRLQMELRQDARSAGRFVMDNGAEYFSIGVHGAVTGRRADLAVIDDPVASFTDANSLKARDRLWEWFRSELLTRIKPEGRIAVAMTRWHSDDLAGRLIAQGGWDVLRLPALAEEADPMGRAPGAALWPEWESRDALIARRDSQGDRHFAAMYQQAPLEDTGLVFDVSKSILVDSVPEGGEAVRGWDLAGCADESRDPDWTVGVLLRRYPDHGLLIEDVRRARVPAAGLSAHVRAVAEEDGPDVRIGLPQDPGQAGLFQCASVIGALSGFTVRTSPERGSKIERAGPVATQFNHARMTIKRAPWNRVFLDELGQFPRGRKDDQVDALARAFDVLAAAAKGARPFNVSLMQR